MNVQMFLHIGSIFLMIFDEISTLEVHISSYGEVDTDQK